MRQPLLRQSGREMLSGILGDPAAEDMRGVWTSPVLGSNLDLLPKSRRSQPSPT